ncbi:hypothetical protein AMTRI_Chr08g161970 [Amborella trichopoda]|uniref:vacuolar amino acid transporter 1 n=1 Tax=Amborella trichopoda TaxID=13333 RepID=UPI0005D31F8B|nr:vacuolar amino acid transporter 1 [Amborella trichopoda]|eukprot:XP_011624172.1 vacuolar amino acid transporter 1 [Amborella trichopoda]
MKNEEMSRERSFNFETDDEENQADTMGNEDYESDGSDMSSTRQSSGHGRSSYDCNTSWPQSYKQSMDIFSSVTPPSLTILAGSSLIRAGSSFWSSSSVHRRHPPLEINYPSTEPLISTASEKEQLTSPHPQTKQSFYDPHGIVLSQQCSYSQAVINGINVLCGVGVLSTPYAVKEGGWLGLLVLLSFALISCYTGVLLKRCLESKPGLHTYPDIGQAAFGKVGRLGISIILYAELYACCVEYVILESDNLNSLFPNAHLNLAGYQLSSHQLFAIITTLAVLPTVWLRDLSVLSYISAGGVIASLLVVICLIWVGVVDGVGFHHGGTSLNLSGLPVAIGLYGFCYSGHAVYPNIYSSMKNPSQFPAVLLTSSVACTILYAGVAIMGYMMFGESINSQFTLNMPQQFFASKVGVWTTVVNPFTKYALTITPVALSLEELLPASHLKYHFFSIVIRTGLVLSTLIVALAVPFFGFVMAFIGSVLTMLVALILPCACYLSILGSNVTLLQRFICMLVIVVGVVCACIGSYSAIGKISEGIK